MLRSLERWIQFGILAVLVLAPTQWSVGIPPKIHVSPVDPVLALTAVLGLWWAWRGRHGQQFNAPSIFAILFVVIGLLSVTVAQNRSAAFKEVAQWGLYFIAGWSLFRYGLQDIKTRRLGVGIVVWVALTIITVSLFQFYHSSVPDLQVRAFFGNRNVLSGFLALVIPFAFAQALAGTNPLAGLAGVVVALVGLCVTLSGAAVLGILVALFAMAAFQGRFAMVLTLAFTLFLLVVIHPNLPRRDTMSDPWLDSIAMHDVEGELSRRYPDWECGWLMMVDHPWRGVGADNYQERISGFRRIPTRPGAPEPDTQNLYLVLGSTLGFPGMLVFIAMLFEGMAVAFKAMVAPVRGQAPDRALALGAFGSLLAYSITAIWHPLLVRGVGIPLVAVLALAHHLHEQSLRR